MQCPPGNGVSGLGIKIALGLHAQGQRCPELRHKPERKGQRAGEGPAQVLPDTPPGVAGTAALDKEGGQEERGEQAHIRADERKQAAEGGEDRRAAGGRLLQEGQWRHFSWYL